MNLFNRFRIGRKKPFFGEEETFRRNQQRYNALWALDPNLLVRHLAAFSRGDISGLARVLDEFETREDKMRIGAFKMAAAVAGKPWEVRIVPGEEENPRAKLHRETLARFWNRAEATDAFCRNRKGGVRLLFKQMMQAQSRVYSVHDIVWDVCRDGGLKATFTHVPAWCFENRTGRLRYIRNDGQTHGEEMPEGEWLVTVGEGVGIAAAVLAMAKRLSWNDWLLFSEKCGMPVIMGNTSAQRGTSAWEAMAEAIRSVAPKTGILADTGTQLSAVSMGGNGQGTYRELVDTVDRAISALYRGGDLATVSSVPSAAGVQAQAGESELMDADGCAMVTETLRDQVETFVIRHECGDEEPLAGIVVNPPAETQDIDREIKIDAHLASLGVKLSKADALARYGRVEAEGEEDALLPRTPAPQGGLPMFGNSGGSLPGIGKSIANEKPQEASSLGTPLPSPGKNKEELPDLGKDEERLAAALQRDLRPVARALQTALARGEGPGELKRRLERILQECGTESAEALEGAMKEAGEENLTWNRGAAEGEDKEEQFDLIIANENPNRAENGEFARAGTGNRTGGKQDETNYERRRRTCQEALDRFNASSDHPDADDVASGKITIESALEKGFSATFGGHRLVFFTDEKVLRKYKGRGEEWKLNLIPEMLGKRNKMLPEPHKGKQTRFIESRSKANAGKKKLVAIADTATGIVVHVGRESEEYIRAHYK